MEIAAHEEQESDAEGKAVDKTRLTEYRMIHGFGVYP